MNKDLKDKTLSELEQIVVGMGQKKYLAKYIFHFVHVEGATEISQITPLSKDVRGQLAEQGFYISQLAIQKRLSDKDGTVKYVFALSDGCQIETVLLCDVEDPLRRKGRRTPHSTRSSLRSSLAQGGSTH